MISGDTEQALKNKTSKTANTTAAYDHIPV